jgi:hypothetical protein
MSGVLVLLSSRMALTNPLLLTKLMDGAPRARVGLPRWGRLQGGGAGGAHPSC